MDVEVRVLFWAPKSPSNYQQTKRIQWHIFSQDHFTDRFRDRFVRFETKSARSENKLTYGLYSAGISDAQKREIVEGVRVPTNVAL